MKKRVFVDSDVILDHLLDRAPFNRHAEILFRKVYQGEIEAFTSPVIFANLFYVLRKAVGADTAKAGLANIITRNAKDYRGNPVALFSAEEYLKSMA